LRQQYVKIVETEKKFKEMLAEYEQKSLDLERTAIPYKVLQREAASDRQLYEAILTRLKETSVTQGLTKTPYRVVEEPLVNSWPVRPDRKKSLMNAALMALITSVGLILLLDYLDSSIRTVDEAEAELELPVLAALPEMPQSKMPKDGVSIMNHAPASSVAESFRNLRSSISLLGDAEHRRVFLLSSAIPSEGKTFTSFNLAVSLASQGLRVLLVDADLRRPALSSLLLTAEERKADDYRGLTDVLSGLSELGTTIRETSVKNLWLLPAGRRAPNPAELLAQPQSAKLISALAKSFNRVIVDSAPINAVSDTLSLAAHVDCIFLVLRFGKTPRRAIQHAIKLLVNAGAKIGGLVLNRMPTGRSAAYYYYYYGDTYVKDSVYGSSHDRKEEKEGRGGAGDEDKKDGSRKRRSKSNPAVAAVRDADD
jgi:polysaccharide biosynthesis transport protein